MLVSNVTGGLIEKAGAWHSIVWSRVSTIEVEVGYIISLGVASGGLDCLHHRS